MIENYIKSNKFIKINHVNLTSLGLHVPQYLQVLWDISAGLAPVVDKNNKLVAADRA